MGCIVRLFFPPLIELKWVFMSKSVLFSTVKIGTRYVMYVVTFRHGMLFWYGQDQKGTGW